jgi:hypothetical protein
VALLHRALGRLGGLPRSPAGAMSATRGISAVVCKHSPIPMAIAAITKAA